MTGTRGRTRPAAGEHLGARPSSQRRQREWSFPQAACRQRRRLGGVDRGPFRSRTRRIGPRPFSARGCMRSVKLDDRSSLGRRQTPRDSSCPPESPCDAPEKAPARLRRACRRRASGPASPRASDDSAGARATRVGCRSRSGASSPVSCGGEGGGPGRELVVAEGTLETRGSMRWALDRRTAASESIARERVPVGSKARLEPHALELHHGREVMANSTEGASGRAVVTL